MEVVVEHSYSAKEPDELTIKKGDVIHDVVKKPGGWWEGVLRDKRGMFPDNFVRPLDQPVTLRSKKDVNRIRQCRVIYSYKQDHEDELSLNVGEVINILGEEEEGWWRGFLNGKEGVFPSNFVQEIVSSASVSRSSSKESLGPIGWTVDNETPLVPPKPAKIVCQVRFSYKAENEDELTINEGDLVTLISKDGQDPGWWKGEFKGKMGVFPDNFVVVLTSEELSHLQKREEYNNQQKKDEIFKKASDEDIKSINNIPKHSETSPTLKDEKLETEPVAKVTPPVPGKKPSISVKKSPSGSGSQGLFSGLRKKISDVVDGATSSKSAASNKSPENKEILKLSPTNENSAFDLVARTPMLQDVRATRAKAPGRRPPSVVMKDGEVGITNGFTNEHSPPLDVLTEDNAHMEIPESGTRLRDQVKVPWLEEMKKNQAKRSSTSPKQEQNSSREKISPEGEEKADKPEKEDPGKPFVTEPPKPKLKPKVYPPDEETVTRRLAPLPREERAIPIRPQSIATASESKPIKLTPSPVLSRISPSRPRSEDKSEIKIHRNSNEFGRSPTDHLKIHISSSTDQNNKSTSESIRSPTEQLRNSVENRQSPVEIVRNSIDHSWSLNEQSKVTTEHVRVSTGFCDQSKSFTENVRSPTVQTRNSLDLNRTTNDHVRNTASHSRLSAGGNDHMGISSTDNLYGELVKRLEKLEKQNADQQVAIEELKSKLQLETDMRLMLQAELEKVSECVMRV